MHQIHNGCLYGALKENGKKETSTIAVMFYFFYLKKYLKHGSPWE